MSDAPSWLFGLLGGLLVLSALFSSAETAFFSLTPTQRETAGSATLRLARTPRRLLITVLLSNLIVNVAYFAFAARLLPRDDGLGDLVVGLAALLALVISGEILPKTIGLRARVGVARWTAPVLLVLVFCLRPITRPLREALERFHERLASWFPAQRGVTVEALSKVLERGAKEGALHELEADLLVEIVELDEIRVREIMTPRVDALFMDVSGRDREATVREALERRISWLPVIDGNPDRVVGSARVRDLVRSAGRPVGQLVMPVKFVPEVASALDLLHSLHADRTAEAVVVDEWGGTAGFVTAEDVFEEIVGDLRKEEGEHVPEVVPLGEGRFRVSGGLSIRDWNEAFGLRVVPKEFETVGGFITALLGRIPRAGDEVRVGALELLVSEVRGRRVLTVDIGLHEDARNGVEVEP